MRNFLPLTDTNASANFKQKTEATKSVINEALLFLMACGIPTAGLTTRRLERIAMAFLAVADVPASEQWLQLKTLSDGRSMTTRNIISYANAHFAENISSGSYDDVRDEDLQLTVLAGIIMPTKPTTARNNSRRGYAIADEYGGIARMISSGDYQETLAAKIADAGSLTERLNPTRCLEQIPIIMPGGLEVDFTWNKHNELQKAVVEQFLPRFGHGAELLYVGDFTDRKKWLQQDRLTMLGFFEIGHGELPDIIAYSPSKNWLFLIEAVYSSGPVSPARLLRLETLCRDCTAERVYVTAFLDRPTFRRFSSDIAWETEAWIAANPDHLIHFNGERFLGPYQRGETA